jgi:hypothetical protein
MSCETSAEWVNRIIRERFSLADWIRPSMIRLIGSGDQVAFG